LVADTEVDKSVPIRVWRDGRELTMKVEVGELKESEETIAAAPGTSKPSGGETIQDLDIGVAAIDDRLRDRYGLEPDARGVIVTSVDPNGPAAEQGVRVGDRIVEVSQEAVSTPSQLAAKIKAAKSSGRKAVLLLVEGEGGMRFVAIKLGQG
jgi:serine protease Do